MTATTEDRPRPRVTRPVWFTGIAVGTALLVIAYWHGWRVRITALPPVLDTIAGAVAAWLACIAIATVGAGLLRRHHKTLAAHALRHGKRGAAAAARAAANGGRSLSAWLAAKASPRWQARSHQPLFFRPLRRSEPTGATPADEGERERADRRAAERRQRLLTGQPAATITIASTNPAGAALPTAAGRSETTR